MKTRKYEILYIIQDNLSQEETDQLIHKVDSFFSDKNIQKDIWGYKELAYPINKFKRGYYVLLNLQANAEEINKFNNYVNLTKSFLRKLVINLEKENIKPNIAKKSRNKEVVSQNDQ